MRVKEVGRCFSNRYRFRTYYTELFTHLFCLPSPASSSLLFRMTRVTEEENSLRVTWVDGTVLLTSVDFSPQSRSVLRRFFSFPCRSALLVTLFSWLLLEGDFLLLIASKSNSVCVSCYPSVTLHPVASFVISSLGFPSIKWTRVMLTEKSINWEEFS